MSKRGEPMTTETRQYLRELRSSRRARRLADADRLAAAAEAQAWNDLHPVGTEVIVTRDDGSELRTRTRSVAWNICGHASVLVEGISGGYLLARVRPVPAKESP